MRFPLSSIIGSLMVHLKNRKYEYKGRRWKRISKAGKAFIDDLLVVDPEDRATDDEALKASWLNRRYSATIRNPKMEEMNLAKDSVLRYARYSKIRQMALMGTILNVFVPDICVPQLLFLTFFVPATDVVAL